MKISILLLMLTVPITSTLAHGNVFEMTEISVSEVLRKFQAEEEISTIRAYKGMRAWPSGVELKVRVFFEEQNSFVYSCQMNHTEGAKEKIVCQKN